MPFADPIVSNFPSSLVEPPNSPTIFAPSVRRSTHVAQPPTYLQDYHCHLLTQTSTPYTTSSYPLAHYVSYFDLSPSHRHFLLNVSSNFEPQFYHQAVPYTH